MALTLGPLTLPAGLRWVDELDWSPSVQTTDYLLSGALVVEESTKQAGRPITMVGGLNFARVSRTEALALQALLDTATLPGLTLTLHDGRQFTVLPRPDHASALACRPVPVVLDSGPANPGPDTPYYIDSLSLLEI